jgi:hypothetical protein
VRDERFIYRHTQVGWVTLFALSAGALFFAAMTAVAGRQLSPWGTPFPYLSVAFAALAVLFSTLTVTVDEQEIEVWFGPGLIRKRLPLSRVEGCRQVRNQWWYGWGIRLIPDGWLWNVSGLEAVELTLKDEGVFRIGTDESQRLSAAINERLPGLG